MCVGGEARGGGAVKVRFLVPSDKVACGTCVEQNNTQIKNDHRKQTQELRELKSVGLVNKGTDSPIFFNSLEQISV